MELSRSICFMIYAVVMAGCSVTDVYPTEAPPKGTVDDAQSQPINKTVSNNDEPFSVRSQANIIQHETTSSSSRESAGQLPSYNNQPIHYVPVHGPPGLPGPPGRAGEPGIVGHIGTTGYSGNNGNHGNYGTPGPVGRSGLNGKNGESGNTGPEGIAGLQGVTGLDGEDGDPGNHGTLGPSGPDGKTGIRGPAGPRGAVGADGPVGKVGPPGLTGFPGVYNPVSGSKHYRAFSVAKTSSLVADDGNLIITWDHEFSNVGGDFNMNTGIFNVTVPGTYFFTIHVAKSSHQNYPLVQLIKNGEEIISVIDYGPSDSEDSSGNSVVLILSKDDAIWLMLRDGRQITSDLNKLTTFSGFLIFQILT